MSSSDSDTSSEASMASDHVLEWYSKIYSRRVDLVGDYAGNELFLIEGDSLLRHCFSDKHIDFHPGFQLLHATWTVERFLSGLVARRCTFHIAFFEKHRELCVPPFAPPETRQKYLLARTSIIRHLSANLKLAHPEIAVNSFTSVNSPEFTEYLEAEDVYFILLHDGSSAAALDKKNILNRDLNEEDDEEDEGSIDALQAKVAFRQLIHWFMDQSYNTALINGLEWQDTKAMATILETSRSAEDEISLTFYGSNAAPTKPPSLDFSRLDSVKSSTTHELTERELITVLVLSLLVSRDKTTEAFANAFLRHAALLSQLTLSQRVVEAAELNEEHTSTLNIFCEGAASILQSDAWKKYTASRKCSCNVADLVDGRILAACLQDGSIGKNESYDLMIQAVGTLGAGGLARATNTSAEIKHSNGQITHSEQSSDSCAVLRFSNDVFDTHLAPVQLDVDRSGEIASSTADRIFRELTHWQNSARPVDLKLREDPTIRAKQLHFARRRNQFFMAEMTAYAASLTSAVGKVLEPEIITTGNEPEKKEDNSRSKAKPKSNKKAAPTKKEAMRAQIAADKSKKLEANTETLINGWHLACKTLEREASEIGRFRKANQYLATLNTESKLNVLEAEVRFYMINTLLSIWVEVCRRNEKSRNMHIAALIFDSLSSFSKFRRPITKTIVNCLKKIFKELSLPELPIPQPEGGDRALAFNFSLTNAPAVSLAISLPSDRFQLLHCGPYFDRSMDSAADPRVPFEPDAWQRRVLDEIDAKRSLLVVAPTSAGKTFISFYAMRSVLESDDDILVYVAPTKALVNQIAAEVQARFAKSYKYAGNSVWAIHTRDYKINNPRGCQVLVTVPHILQIMLLASSNAKSWSQRIKWIIFDEVHCIGQAEDGIVWEQLLLMAPCPIIALSATIGNPDEFSDWLTSTQRAVGNDLVMVQHPHRYSDLRKFIFAPDSNDNASTIGPEFQGLSERHAFAQLGLEEGKDFKFIHPVASLVNRLQGIPRDLSLEARDCLTLWQSMSKHQTSDYPLEKALDPAIALPSIVKKMDIIKWEKSLKTVLSEWIADIDSPFEHVLKDLSASSSGVDNKIDTDVYSEEEDSPLDVKSILSLLAKLHEQDALPGIVFNYDRGICERICSALMSQLEDAETKWKESSPKWKADLQKWEEYKKAVAKAGKRGPPKLPKKGASGEEGLTKQDLMRDAANNEANPWASFDPNKPIEKFHFADNKKLSRDEMAGYERELYRRQVPEWLIKALHRGIGVHHAGLNRKYRQVCEMLFRKGYLRVVIATGTLALGINMPCKTVIFSGDSVFLTALNYRQAAGRAGRRGFDMLGNVVFHGISTSKVHRLISSRLPDINGHFPITTTLVLRLLTLLDESKNSPFAKQAVNALLSQPRLYLGGEESKITVLHHLRFSIEYLRRQFLLDSSGSPLNFAGCVSHLYFTENSAFAFHALLKEGYFHKLCANIGSDRDAVLQELLLTLSHLFGRQYCRQADEEYVEEVVKRSPSIVFLPPMPADAAAILRDHNQSTLDIYKAYIHTFVDQHVKEPDNSLPLTAVKMGSAPDSRVNSGPQSRPPAVVRSPFVALSGHGDSFDSVHDLCMTSRSGIFLEEALVPYVRLHPDETELPLNAYLYDFFNHGDVAVLASANRIRRGDVWFVLNDFSMVLATIVTSFSNYMKLSDKSDLDYSEVRGEGDEAEEHQDDKFMPEDSGYETASTTSVITQNAPAQNNLPIQTKKKKKVADSWDDDADEEDIEDEVEEKEQKMREAQLEETSAWEENQGLLNVLKAFKALREEFDVKFRAMWA